MPSLKCPHCSRILRVNESAAGKQITCPVCKQKFLVPRPRGAAAGPLPVSNAGRAWHIHVNGRNAGPYSVDVIIDQFRAGKINGDTLAWKEGMGDWQPLKELSDFRAATDPAARDDRGAPLFDLLDGLLEEAEPIAEGKEPQGAPSTGGVAPQEPVSLPRITGGAAPVPEPGAERTEPGCSVQSGSRAEQTDGKTGFWARFKARREARKQRRLAAKISGLCRVVSGKSRSSYIEKVQAALALARMGSDEQKVRKALSEGLSAEDRPLVAIALLNALTSIGPDETAVEPALWWLRSYHPTASLASATVLNALGERASAAVERIMGHVLSLACQLPCVSAEFGGGSRDEEIAQTYGGDELIRLNLALVLKAACKFPTATCAQLADGDLMYVQRLAAAEESRFVRQYALLFLVRHRPSFARSLSLTGKLKRTIADLAQTALQHGLIAPSERKACQALLDTATVFPDTLKPIVSLLEKCYARREAVAQLPEPRGVQKSLRQ